MPQAVDRRLRIPRIPGPPAAPIVEGRGRDRRWGRPFSLNQTQQEAFYELLTQALNHSAPV
jgi:hypothetical protein